MSDQVSKKVLANPSTTLEKAREAIHRILEIIATKIAQEIVAEPAQRARQTTSISVTRVTERPEP